MQVIGENNVAVPTHLFKAILATNSSGEACLAAFEVPNEPIKYEKKLANFQVPLEKLEKDSGFSFFETIEKLKTKNLCEVTRCKLMTKEDMERVVLRRDLRNAQSVEQLDLIWKKLQQDNKPDSYISALYEKKLTELQEKT